MRFRKSLCTVVLLLCVGGLTACSSGTKDPSARISEALKTANLGEVTVEYDQPARIVHLTGVVASQADRDRALEVAIESAGGFGTISNDLTVRATKANTETVDQRVKRLVQDLVDRDRGLRRRGMTIKVTGGVVELSGSVTSVGEKNRASRLARSIAGVKDVTNRLKVKRPNVKSKRSTPGRA